MAAAGLGRRIARGVGFTLLAALLLLAARCWQTSRPAVWTLTETASPDGQIVATIKSEDGWGYAKDFVSLRRAAERDRYDPLIVIDYGGEPALLLRWRGDRDLDVGVPAWSAPDVRKTEKNGVRLKIVRYPDPPAAHDEAELIGQFDRMAAYRLTAGPVTYTVSRRQEPDGRRFCSVGFVTDGGPLARRIGVSVEAHIDKKNNRKRNFADFVLALQIRGIQDPALSRLFVTGAQAIGAAFATSMIPPSQWQHFDGRPASGGAFDLYLDRESDVRNVLGVLAHAPYKLAFLWDLPDTVAVYAVDGSPAAQDVAAFFECVGDATPWPVFSFPAGQKP